MGIVTALRWSRAECPASGWDEVSVALSMVPPATLQPSCHYVKRNQRISKWEFEVENEFNKRVPLHSKNVTFPTPLGPWSSNSMFLELLASVLEQNIFAKYSPISWSGNRRRSRSTGKPVSLGHKRKRGSWQKWHAGCPAAPGWCLSRNRLSWSGASSSAYGHSPGHSHPVSPGKGGPGFPSPSYPKCQVGLWCLEHKK